MTDEEKKELELFVKNIDELEELNRWSTGANIFDILKVSKTEIRHSNILAWLFNPNENHGLGDSFIKRFLQYLIKNEIINYNSLDLMLDDFYSYNILREWKNIDILLHSEENGGTVIVIENKIESGENGNQLFRYKKIVDDNYCSYRRKIFLYLTPDGRNSSDIINWISINYETIFEIITELLEHEEIHDNVKLILKDYIEILRRDVMEEDRELVEICDKIYNKYKNALDLIFNNRTNKNDFLWETINAKIKDVCKTNNQIYQLQLQNNKIDNCFLSKSMDCFLPRLNDAISSWGDNYLYRYWFKIKNENTLFLIFELGGYNVDDKSKKIMKMISDYSERNNKKVNREEFRYKRIYTKRYQFIDEDIYDLEKKVDQAIKDALIWEKELIEYLNKSQ